MMYQQRWMAVLAALAMTTGICGMMLGQVSPEMVLTASAEEYEQLTYEVQEDGTITITGCAEDAVSLEIPAEIDGKPVTSIGECAFSYCTGLTKIAIPDSVTSIGAYTFYACTGLTDIIIPDSVTSIGGLAFDDTAWYNAQSDGVVYLGNWLYTYKGDMPDNTSVVVKEGTTGIAGRAFSGCTELTDITISDSVTSIGGYAFGNCTRLTEITIPDSVTSIGECAFTYCTGLTDIMIPDSVTSIEGGTFSCCTGLTDITIPDSVTNVGWSAFCDCTGLTDITIPDSVTNVGWSAFYGCTGLTDITILSPDCEIGGYDAIPTITTIHGYENSTAQAYAEANGNPFVSLGEAPAIQLLYGDANDDGEITIVDVVKLCRCAMGADTLTKAGAANADVDGNGTADATDASYIIQSLVGLVTLPVEL